MMLATLLYAWCSDIRSSRRIAKACENLVAFLWLTGNIQPDHCAFARFRSRLEEALNHLFAQELLLCYVAGLAKAGRVFLDGTKMLVNGSLVANLDTGAAREEDQQAAGRDADERRRRRCPLRQGSPRR